MLEGNGTAQQPYIIKTQNDLQEINNHLSAHFRLDNDIELTGEFAPIANQFEPFTGMLDGNNKTITGLNIKTATQYAGLFAYSTGTISGLKVENAHIHAVAFAGVIAGYNGGRIVNCTTGGIVEGTALVGEIAGYTDKNGVTLGSSVCQIISTESCTKKRDTTGMLTIFVSPLGNDQWTGSKEEPLRTIEAAKVKVRQLIVGGAANNIPFLSERVLIILIKRYCLQLRIVLITGIK